MFIFAQERKEKWIQILKIAWPLIVANSFWNLQLTIDRIYLGHYSTESLGAAMTVMGVFWTPMALLQQTSGYATTFVAQYFGAKELKMIGPSIWQSIYVSVLGGILFLLLLFASSPFFAMLGHSSSMTDLEIAYFDSLCYSALPMALIAAFSGFFTGLGETKMVMWINVVGVVMNIILDYLLIFGNFGFPALGIAGAGYATTLGNWVGALFGFYLVFQRGNDELYNLWKGWRWDGKLLKKFIRYGFPSGIQWALEGLAFTVFMIVLGGIPNGDAALAGSSIAVTVMMLAVLPSMGIAQAVMVLVGQHLGQKRPDLAENDSWAGLQVVGMYMMMIGMTFLLFPEFYLSWFENRENQELWSQVSFLVPYLLMYIALFTCFDSVNLTFSFALKGAGDTKFVSLMALFLPWPLMVIPTFLVKDWEGAIFWAWGAASVYSLTLALVFWRRFVGGKWKSMSVISS